MSSRSVRQHGLYIFDKRYLEVMPSLIATLRISVIIYYNFDLYILRCLFNYLNLFRPLII
jgi:hypothetical protein